MAALGAYWALFVTGTPLDSIAAIGFIILIGVVVNNGIVLIELVTRLRREGLPRQQALVEASCRRLRPILMTAMTTIFGILPMAYGGSGNSGISYTPMGRVVVGGLTAGTLLTLFMVPVLYSMLDNLRPAMLSFVTGPRRPTNRWRNWSNENSSIMCPRECALFSVCCR